MNLWECDHPDCNASAVGEGGAVGLRAIGWYFKPGPILYCPRHRPDAIPCVEPCRRARATRQAVPELQGRARGESD